jgi:asparagine synthase (glutamine-hydrolysing)
MLYFDLKVWLPDDLLLKADKMTMAASLELRVPFLDHEFVEWAWRLPSSLKIRAGVGKYLMRQAMGGLIPASILNRPKLGFPVPIHSWFRNALSRNARELLLDERSECSRYFDRTQVEALIEQQEGGREDLSGEIYALAVFALWHRLFIEASSVSTTPPPLDGVGS